MKRAAVSASAILLLILAGFGGSAATQAARSSTPPKHDKPIRGYFDIGGRKLYLVCAGSGRPTVVMDAGLANGVDAWDAVAPAISKLTRTCTYDRANIGQSDDAPTPRTLRDFVSDLRRLLVHAGVKPPYLLVGHSLGGLDMRLYAGEHPHDVVGLVLIDPTPTTFLADICSISADACSSYTAEWAANPEGVQFEKSAHQVDAAKLPRIPLVVLTATIHVDQRYSAEGNKRFQALWQRAQQRVAASVPGGKLEVVKGGHVIQDEHPRVVVAAISAVLKRAR
jgi:pimeloyl-ACP methyl ester carboxylesterase